MKKSLALTAVAAAMFTIQAGADTTTNTTTATAPSSLRDNISATLASFLYGPSIGHINSAFQPDADGNIDTSSKQLIDNSLIGTYKLNDKTKLSLAANFRYIPVTGQDMILLDPTIKVSRSGIIDNNGLSFGGSARVYIPVSPTSRSKNSLGTLRIDPSLGFQPAGSRFSAAIDGDYRARFTGGDVTYTRFTLWTLAHIDYQLNGNTSFSLGTEISSEINKREWNADPTKFSAGASFQVLPALNLNPCFSVPFKNVSLNATQLFLGVTANLL